MTRQICPACGALASAETWILDAAHRDTWAIIIKLPSPVAQISMSYLSLFRPAKSALSWIKAKRLAGELAVLVASGHLQVQGRPSRPCPAKIWSQAIDEMLDRRDRLSRPLKNHNYLRQVAYELADKADASSEHSRNEQEKNGNFQRPKSTSPLAKMMGFEDDSPE